MSGMAGADGFVVFQRGKESDESDIWDDTALIKAYDNAVSIMKSRLAEREGQDGSEDPSQTQALSDGKGGKKKKKKRHRPKKKQTNKWKMGDNCRAVYTEDGLLYDAEIIGLDTAGGLCTVRYTEYGNEEDHPLTDLLPPRPSPRSDANIVSESDSNDITMKSPLPPRSGRGRSSGAAAEQHPHLPPFDSYPFFHGMPHPSSRYQTGSGPQFAIPRVPPMPPPPPLPQVMAEDAVSDDEALSSMLISWYMSGYHTGYYQGLQQGRQQLGGGAAR